jgi:hypothetical protein
MDKTQLETLLSSLDWWTGFFTLLVVIGVGGEFVTHIWSSRASGRLISIQNEEGKALQIRAAELERANLEIKQKMAWRSLIGDERKTFVASVRSPNRQITVVELEDGESWNYAENLFSALKEAGWAAGKNYRRPYDSGGVPQGVICRISDNPDPMVQIVVKALEKAGANPTIERGSQLRPDFIEITVGLRSIQ